MAEIVIHGHKTPPAEIDKILPLQLCGQSCDYFFSANFTEAWVFSQLICKVQAPPAWLKAMVKFSTGAEVLETDMGIRASSSDSYLYGIPHSPVCLLTMRVHLSCSGKVKMV